MTEFQDTERAMAQIEPLPDAARWAGEIVTITPEMCIDEIARTLWANRIGCLVVVATALALTGFFGPRKETA